MARKEYDVAIVGAGPSGLLAAAELAKLHGKQLSVGLFDKGNDIGKRTCPTEVFDRACTSCEPCGVTDGVMGAGLKSDGKLHFHKEVVELFRMGLLSAEETDHLLTYVEQLLEAWGLSGPVYPLNLQAAIQLSDQVESLDLGDAFELKVKQRTRHVGSDRLPLLVANLVREIMDLGDIDLQVRTSLVSYDNLNGESKLTLKRRGVSEQVVAGKTFIGLGRRGSLQVQGLIDRFSIPHSYRPVEIGGRVEVPYEVMRRITAEVYNPCFRQKNSEGTATFTFCANPEGRLTTESLIRGIVGVNGESSAGRKSVKTNFAVLTELPIGDGEHPNDVLVKLLKEGFLRNRPLVQTTADFIDGRMADEFRQPETTLTGLEYANVARVFPTSVTVEISNFLQRLDIVCPGVISHQALFVVPEAKIRGIRVSPQNAGLSTNVDGLYLIGDSAGLSGNIAAAAVTGVVAARDV
jgi:uncharacterized FAD-dependent dehydrogenase